MPETPGKRVYIDELGNNLVIGGSGTVAVERGGTLNAKAGSTSTFAGTVNAEAGADVTVKNGAALTVSGTQTVSATGIMNFAAGAKMKAAGTQAAAIADVPTGGSADAAANAAAINSLLAAARGVGLIAST
jgi:hypothetical protein